MLNNYLIKKNDYELKPDDEKITYNGTDYYRTWDYDILSLREKTVIGYYDEVEKNILFIENIH